MDKEQKQIITKPSGVVFALILGVRSMAKHPWLSLLLLASTGVQGALQGLLIWSLRKALLEFSGGGAISLAEIAVAIFMLWLLLSLSMYVAEVVSIGLGHKVEIGAMYQVLGKLLRLSVGFYDRNSQGNFVISSYHDLKGIRGVTLEVGKIILYGTRLAGLGVAAWVMSPKLAIMSLVTVPLGAIPAYWFGQRITQAANRERDALTTLYDSFFQVSSGIRIIKANCGEGRVMDQARLIGHELYKQVMQQTKAKGVSRLLLEAVSGVGLILVLTVGGHDVARGTLQWQSLLGLLIAVMAVYGPVVGLLQTYTTIRTVIPNLDRVQAIISATPEIQDKPGALRLREAPKIIELKNVSFAYNNINVLNSINTRFHAGETIGIVGPSGAGKSTLLALLLRFYDPTQGAVLVDGIDMRDIRQSDWLDLSAIVLQEPFLLVDTVANNIRMGRPNASMEEVIAAAKAANLHDEILMMEQGYETVLGRRKDARLISGGQKQRLCIAAALLKNAPFLFLDEATSSLDSVSEQKVQDAVQVLMKGRTTFVIAHRLSTLRNANRVVVLNQGRLVGFGTHHELLDHCKIYQELWNCQGSYFSEIVISPEDAQVVTA
ncbi:MAG TPA: ABC transporter ATP-binding protein [Pyrinomonadaceae bacterium]|nr:ABC transporter ATP-binding protein [Pyrinomonadaceae bacterium]